MKKILLILVIFTYSCKTQIIEPERTYFTSETNVKQHNISANYINPTIFYFIRHSESNGNQRTNPSLSKTGLQRAMLYEEFFSNKNIDYIFTTNLNRTIETANIIANSKGLSVNFHNPFKINYKDFFDAHKHNSIIVVGHSNTTPNFVNKMIGKVVYSQIVEDNYSNIFKVILKNGEVISHQVLILEEEIERLNDAKLTPKELKKTLRERKRIARNTK